jgi:hypothetical protein
MQSILYHGICGRGVGGIVPGECGRMVGRTSRSSANRTLHPQIARESREVVILPGSA